MESVYLFGFAGPSPSNTQLSQESINISRCGYRSFRDFRISANAAESPSTYGSTRLCAPSYRRTMPQTETERGQSVVAQGLTSTRKIHLVYALRRPHARGALRAHYAGRPDLKNLRHYQPVQAEYLHFVSH